MCGRPSITDFSFLLFIGLVIVGSLSQSSQAAPTVNLYINANVGSDEVPNCGLNVTFPCASFAGAVATANNLMPLNGSTITILVEAGTYRGNNNSNIVFPPGVTDVIGVTQQSEDVLIVSDYNASFVFALESSVSVSSMTFSTEADAFDGQYNLLNIRVTGNQYPLLRNLLFTNITMTNNYLINITAGSAASINIDSISFINPGSNVLVGIEATSDTTDCEIPELTISDVYINGAFTSFIKSDNAKIMATNVIVNNNSYVSDVFISSSSSLSCNALLTMESIELYNVTTRTIVESNSGSAIINGLTLQNINSVVESPSCLFSFFNNKNIFIGDSEFESISSFLPYDGLVCISFKDFDSTPEPIVVFSGVQFYSTDRLPVAINISTDSVDITLYDCSFVQNTNEASLGGAVSVFVNNTGTETSTLSITNCTFSSNTANGGGALALWGVKTTILLSTFELNSVTNPPSTMSSSASSYVNLICPSSPDMPVYAGGAIYAGGNESIYINSSTFSSNSAFISGVIACCSNPSPVNLFVDASSLFLGNTATLVNNFNCEESVWREDVSYCNYNGPESLCTLPPHRTPWFSYLILALIIAFVMLVIVFVIRLRRRRSQYEPILQP